jgi:hypothetical protein
MTKLIVVLFRRAAAVAQSYVQEFVVHHFRLGIEQFHFFSDNQDDSEEHQLFVAQLKPFIDKQIVHVSKSTITVATF